MKKLILISLLFALSACDGIADFLDVEIHRDAKQTFIAANGNALEVIEANAVAPVRVPVNIQRDANNQPTGIISFSANNQCTQNWNISTVQGYESFWLGVGAGAPASWYVTYDAAENQCPTGSSLRHCGGQYTAVMDVQTARITIECWTQ